MARLRRIFEIGPFEPITPASVLGVQCQVVLGLREDGSTRVRGYRYMFAGYPIPPHEALGLERGQRGSFDGIIDDARVEGISLVAHLALDPVRGNPADEAVILVRRIARVAGARVAGRELMSPDGEWAFPAGSLVGMRVRASCYREGDRITVGAVDPVVAEA